MPESTLMKQLRQEPNEPSPFEQLLAVSAAATFFLTPNRQSYVRLPDGSATPIYSEHFRGWLLTKAAQHHLPIPSPHRLAHVLRHQDNILQTAKWLKHPVHKRIASQPDGTIFIDLQTAENDAIEITRRHWTHASHHPAIFRRPELNLPLPVPTFSSPDLAQHLAKSLAIAEPAADALVNWLSLAMVPNTTAPILVITGEARIEAARLLRNIIDPVIHPLFPLPVTAGQLGQLAQWNNVLAFDAGSQISEGRKAALRRLHRGIPVRVREVSRRQAPLYETMHRPILIAADAPVEVDKHQLNIEINQCLDAPLDQLLAALLNEIVGVLKAIEAPHEAWHIEDQQFQEVLVPAQCASASKPFT